MKGNWLSLRLGWASNDPCDHAELSQGMVLIQVGTVRKKIMNCENLHALVNIPE